MIFENVTVLEKRGAAPKFVIVGRTTATLGATMFLVYGDESLDETRSRVCAVGGLVGVEGAWKDLDSKWKQLHGGTPFHANHCDRDHGDYEPKPGEDADAKHKANKELYKASVILLVNSEIGGFASAYDLAAQREAFPPPYGPPVYYQPFMDVLQAMGNFALHRDDQAELTFDSRIESEHNAGLIYAHIRDSSPEWKQRFASKISFGSSRNNPRIQMADLFAREAMKALDNEVGPVKRRIRKSWEALRGTGRFVVYSFSRQYFADLKRDIPNLEEALGFNASDYAAWLQKKNRQWSVTNFFEFLTQNLRQMPTEKREAIGKLLEKQW
ncbi:MAG: DUF3800 domain-containing protein [Terracidiphilus sp.]